MTSNRKLHVLGLATALVGGLSIVVACGGSDDDGGGGGGSSGGSSQCPDCITPPSAPSDGVPGDGAGTVLAASTWYFGNTTRDGSPNPDAWKKFGYDLDGVKSSRTSTGHCQLAEGASDAVKTDGDGGIDNSFGPNLLPLLEGLDSEFAASINDNVAAGGFAMILEIEKLGAGSSYVDLPAALYFGADLGGPPSWDGSDEWPLYCDLMTDCKESGTMQREDGNESQVQFPNSHVANGTWVSGPPTTVTLVLSVGGVTFSLDVKQGIITAELGSGDPPTSATNGTIAGILETEALVAQISQAAGFINTSLCEGSALDELKNSIRQASDIMSDGSQDPNSTCNGISVAMGIDMQAVQLGSVVDKDTDVEDPCAN